MDEHEDDRDAEELVEAGDEGAEPEHADDRPAETPETGQLEDDEPAVGNETDVPPETTTVES